MSEFPLVRQAQRDLSLGRLALAVFDLLRDRLDFVKFRAMKEDELSIALDRSKPQIRGALKELISGGYIERGDRAYARGPYTYRLMYSKDQQPAPQEKAPAPYGMVSRGVDW